MQMATPCGRSTLSDADVIQLKQAFADIFYMK
jgi:hypothetical protein